MRKIFTILFLTALCLVSVPAFADESGTTGDCTWTLTGTGDNLTLTISGTGAMGNYTGSTPCPWSSYSENIKTLVINNGVTIIGNSAFAGCYGLTSSITIPNSVTSIGDYAFYGCTGLTSVTISNSVMIIGNSAFASCYGLTSVDIPNSVTSIGNSAFEDCYGLTSVTISNSVTSIGNAVFRSTGLTSVDIPNSVTTIGEDAFYGCIGLTSVTIPNSVTSIGNYAFLYCSGLTSVDISNSVRTIGENAFYGCYGLTSVTIPNSVTSIGSSAFSACPLSDISVSSENTSYKLANNVGSGKMVIPYADNGFDGGNMVGSLVCGDITIPNTVTTIGNSAFLNCSGLTSVSIPNSVMTIGNSAFRSTGLTSVSIPNSVTSIGNLAFAICRGLTSVDISNSVTSIGTSAFYNCGGLTDVTVYWETPLGINSDVFYGLTLSDITLHVPTGTTGLYQAASVWKDFNITDDATSGVQDVSRQPLQVSVSGGELSISCESPVRRVEIYSLSGSLVVEESNFAGKINVASLPAGVYVVRAGNETAKFVKE